MKPTFETYQTFQASYDFFNERLFEGQLPQCFIVLHRANGVAGYFHAGQFVERGRGNREIDEISINPEHLQEADQEIMQTLVHEMCHLWQAHFGRPSRRGYHNKEWANKMVTIGLIPSHNGLPGGKMTGERMGDYVAGNGRFAQAFSEWQQTHQLKWAAKSQLMLTQEGRKYKRSKIKYSCPSCGQNAWAKPQAALACGHCLVAMVVMG